MKKELNKKELKAANGGNALDEFEAKYKDIFDEAHKKLDKLKNEWGHFDRQCVDSIIYDCTQAIIAKSQCKDGFMVNIVSIMVATNINNYIKNCHR